MGALAVLLLTAVTGCGGAEKPSPSCREDPSLCDKEPGNTPPTVNTLPAFVEGTQSATRAQARQTVTFLVTARDAETPSLRFSWVASAGTLGRPKDTATTSEVRWTAPTSTSGASTVTVTATVSDEHGGSASRSFTLALEPGPAPALFVAGGRNHSLALLGDGTVWSWGYNGSGQLGDGSTAPRAVPRQVSGLSGITAVAASDDHSLALRDDGTVWAWGNNSSGELGDGTTTQRPTPVQVSGLAGVTALATGGHHSLALRGDGTVWAWGDNSSGQLGDGTSALSTLPVSVPRP